MTRQRYDSMCGLYRFQYHIFGVQGTSRFLPQCYPATLCSEFSNLHALVVLEIFGLNTPLELAFHFGNECRGWSEASPNPASKYTLTCAQGTFGYPSWNDERAAMLNNTILPLPGSRGEQNFCFGGVGMCWHVSFG